MIDTPPNPPTPAPPLHRFISDPALDAIIHQAKCEDLGPKNQDLTSEPLIQADQLGTAIIRSRQQGMLAGLALVPAITNAYDPAITVHPQAQDGEVIQSEQTLAELAGPWRSILAAERVVLNFLTHLSGVATTTHQYARAVQGNAQIFDTRKTLPGLRALQKYAVVCGGGHAHRFGLYDAVLVKDNHLAVLPSDKRADALGALIDHIDPAHAKFIEVEVDHLNQLAWVLPKLAEDHQKRIPRIVLLDNMSITELEQAVALRNQTAPAVLLEASGGVTLETVGRIARTGVDRIAVGALTHSAPALDIGLDLS